MENKEKVLDALYSARWCMNQDPVKTEAALIEITRAIGLITGADDAPAKEENEAMPPERETPSPIDPVKATLCIVVGHEKKAPGARLATGGSEYEYNNTVAHMARMYSVNRYPNLKVEIIHRDGIGISGAYKKAAALNPDALIELHFNAFNGKAKGTETLCSVNMNDKKLAAIIHAAICKTFERGGPSRGVKVLSRSDRGGQSLYSAPGAANCLVEPFFGDNEDEAKLALQKKVDYAECLIDATVDFLRSGGIHVDGTATI